MCSFVLIEVFADVVSSFLFQVSDTAGERGRSLMASRQHKGLDTTHKARFSIARLFLKLKNE
jgi:hypothetical protein